MTGFIGAWEKVLLRPRMRITHSLAAELRQTFKTPGERPRPSVPKTFCNTFIRLQGVSGSKLSRSNTKDKSHINYISRLAVDSTEHFL